MLLSEGRFLKPSKETRVLAILDSLADDCEISQIELGKRLNLSGAMVNQYLRQMQQDHLIEFKPVNGKSFKYVLTDSGRDSRSKLLADYSSETIRLYTSVKNHVIKRLNGLNLNGSRKVALFGASETCEVVLSALTDTDYQVTLLMDNDPAKQGQTFHGHVVCPPEVLKQVDCDAVVITSFGGRDEIFEQLEPLSTDKGFKVVRF